MEKQEFCALCFGIEKMIRNAQKEKDNGTLSDAEYEELMERINTCPVRFREDA